MNYMVLRIKNSLFVFERPKNVNPSTRWKFSWCNILDNDVPHYQSTLEDMVNNWDLIPDYVPSNDWRIDDLSPETSNYR